MRLVIGVAVLISQDAWADCVYTGAKRAYLTCIYDEAVAAAAQAAQAMADLIGLDARLVDSEAALTGLDGRVTALEGGALSLQSRMGQAESDIDALDTRTSLVEVDIDGLYTDLGDMSDDLTALGGQVSDLSSDVAALEGTTLSAYDARLDALEAQVQALQDSTAELRVAAMHCHWNGTTYDNCQATDDVNGGHTRLVGFRLADKPTVAAGYTGLVSWPIAGAGDRDPHCIMSDWFEHNPGSFRVRTDAYHTGMQWGCARSSDNVNVAVSNCAGWQTWVCFYDP